MKYAIIHSGAIHGFSNVPIEGYTPISQDDFNKHFADGYDIRETEGCIELYEGERFIEKQKQKMKDEYKILIDKKQKNDDVVKNLTDIGKGEKSNKAQKKSDNLVEEMTALYDEAVLKYGEENVDNFLFGQNS